MGVAILYEWFQLNKEMFIAEGVELEFRDSGRGSAYVRLDTKIYMAELSAWDHALCLDIQTIHQKSEETKFTHTGSCESLEIFKMHLQEFVVWFKNEAV